MSAPNPQPSQASSFMPLGTAMNPLISQALADVLIGALPSATRHNLQLLVSRVGVAGTVFAVSADPTLRHLWDKLVETMVVLSIGHEEGVRRGGSDICRMALTGGIGRPT